MVVDELRKIGFANMADYMKSTPEGDPGLAPTIGNPHYRGCAG
jgi:hypothetical protein